MVAIGDVFSVAYGNKKYHNKETLHRVTVGTPLIASGRRNNGVYGHFPIPATKRHIISVASTGSAGATFFHGYDCEVSDDALVLTPKTTLDDEGMLWFVYMIRLNQHRFNYGRKVTPDRLISLCVPDYDQHMRETITLTKCAKEIALEFDHLALTSEEESRDCLVKQQQATVADLFTIKYGNSYELSNLKLDKNGINLVSRTTQNNGVSAKVARTNDEPFAAGCISVALGSQGGVLESSVQIEPFYTARDVAVLTAKCSMSLEEKLFYCLAIKLHKFRYNFGRQANRTLGSLKLPPLPSWVVSIKPSEAKADFATMIRSMFQAPSARGADTQSPPTSGKGQQILLGF